MKKCKAILFTLCVFSLALNVKAEPFYKQNNDKNPTGIKRKPIGMAVEFTSHSACAHIAKNKGWFREEGINLRTYDSYVTGMALASALARGGIEAAYICLIPAINAYANAGVPIKVVAGIHKYGYGIVVNPDKIKTIKDLEDLNIRIGCTREGGPTDSLLHKMIERYHLDREKILKKVKRMNSPKQLIAIKMGQLDAGILCEQYPTMAEELGFKVLLSAEDIWPGMQGSVLVVTDDLIKEHPLIVKKLVKVTHRANKWLNSNPEDAAHIVASGLTVEGERIFPIKTAKIAAGLKITPQVMLRSLTEKLVCSTEISPEEVQKTIDYMVKSGYVKERFKAEEILDLRFLNEE
ncbi:MAG: ABC transporter substrate-binding protein [Thermodesulfobacteriota bacterium]|nr:ABC transporter substrate-binding protein [Thermodesulfobacteriota bacterium]